MNTHVIRNLHHKSALIERETDGLVNDLLRRCRRSRQHATDLVELLMQWQRRSNERALLRDLGAYELRDIGLTRADVLVEADKPFWRA
jgi:uncharacterized protein YjiS (DUF1127 family)